MALPVLLIILLAAVSPFTAAVFWVDDVRFTTHADFDGIPAITQTHDGTIWLFWTRCVKTNYDVYYKTSTDGGASWSTATALTTDPAVDVSPSACQTVDGVLWVAWASKRTGTYDVYIKTWNGTAWSNATRVTVDPAEDLSPSIAEASDGTVWLAWSSSRTGSYDVYYKTWNDAAWSNATQLTTSPGQDKLPSILMVDNGDVWIAWGTDSVGNGDIFYKTFNGVAWSSETRLTYDSNVDSDPSLLQTVNRRIWLFWSSRHPVQTATNDIYYTTSLDYGASWSESIQLTSDTCDDVWPDLVQTRGLTLWVVWTSDRADQPDYGNWDVYYRTSLVGDVNEDGSVNIMDLVTLSQAYWSSKGNPNYDADLDLNGDGIIDLMDLSIVGRNYGETA